MAHLDSLRRSLRRTFVTLCALAAVMLSVVPVHTQQPPLVIGPDPGPQLRSVDDVVLRLLQQYSIPGAVVGIVRDGRLVFIRGYGYADPASQTGVELDSQFRIASVSKPLTATAILKLVEQGKVSLDNRVFDILPPTVPVTDPRIFEITVRQLLEHKGGWDPNGTGYDPMFRDQEVSVSVGKPLPIQCADTIQHMMSRALDFAPGSRSSYSNFGYCVLGQLIEKLSGVPYDRYVRDNILTPLEMTRTELGRSAKERAAPHEVAYADYPGAPLLPTVLDASGTRVPIPYGAFSLEAMKANGGWISTVADMLRFAAAQSGARPPSVLAYPPPGFPGYVPPTDMGYGWVFHGSLPGTSAIMFVSNNATSGHRTDFAVLMNSRPESGDLLGAMTNGISDVLKVVGVNDWPMIDLFRSRFEPSDAAIELFYDGSASSTLSRIVPVTMKGDSVPVVVQTDASAAWLTATAQSSYAPTGLTVAVRPDATPAIGDYTGWVTVSSPLAENRFRVRVHLQMLAAPPAAPSVASLTISPTSGTAFTGTVTLTGPARSGWGGEVVTLTSSNPGAAAVPATITVLPGQLSATFPVTTTSVTIATSVAITATAGGTSRQATLTVLPQVWLASIIVPASVSGARTVTGTVALNSPTSTAAVVALSSSTPWVAVDGTVTVGAGKQTASFSIRTGDTATPVSATISASYGGVTQQASLTVLPVFVSTVTLIPNRTCSGSGLIWTKGLVSLDGPAPAGGAIVGVASSNPTIARVYYFSSAPTVTVPAGQKSTEFWVDLRGQRLEADTDVVFSATYRGATKQGTLTLLAPFLNSIRIDPNVVKGGQSRTGTVEIQCFVPKAGEVVTLSSSNPAVASVPATVLASSSTSFTVTTKRVTTSTLVYLYATYRGVTDVAWITVTP